MLRTIDDGEIRMKLVDLSGSSRMAALMELTQALRNWSLFKMVSAKRLS
jgi:hypothetical protein